MTVGQLFYPNKKTSEFEMQMEAFYRLLEAKLNALPYNNKNTVVDKDPTNVLDIYFEEKLFKSDFNWFISN